MLKSGAHPTREIAACVKRLGQSGVAVRGAVLNGGLPRPGGYFGRNSYAADYGYRPAGTETERLIAPAQAKA